MQKKTRSHSIVLIFFLLIHCSAFSQAGVDVVPNDPFSAPPGQYYQRALFSLISADNSLTNSGDETIYNDCLKNIEMVYKIEGNYAGALELLVGIPKEHEYNPALQFANTPTFSLNMQQVINELKKKVDVTLLQSNFNSRLSEIYDAIGDHQKALYHQLLVCRLLIKQPADKNEYITALILLGERYISTDDSSNAGEVYTLAAKEMQYNTDTLNKVRYLFLKALLSQKKNKLQDAIDIYKHIFSTGKRLPQYYEMAFGLGCVYMQSGQYQSADSVIASNFSKLHQLGYQSVIFSQLGAAWSENLLFMGKTEPASKNLISLLTWMIYNTQMNSKGFSENEELSYVKRIGQVLDVLYTILYKNSIAKNQKIMRDVLFIELQYRDLVLLNKQELRKESQPKKYFYMNKNGTLTPAPTTESIIAHQYALPYKKRHLDIDSLEELSEQAAREYSAHGFGLSPYDQAKESVLVFETQPGTANIEFVRFIYKDPNPAKDIAMYAAFVFKQSFIAATFVPLCSEQQIIKLTKEENGEPIDENQLSDRLYGVNSAYAKTFYRLIWQPLNNYLSHVNEIHYSPSGILNNISVDALYNGKNYLLDNYNIRCFYSLTQGTPDKDAYQKPETFTAWGDINFNDATFDDGTFIKFVEETKRELNKEQNQLKDADTVLFYSLGNYEIKKIEKACDIKHVKFRSFTQNFATEDDFKTKADYKLKGVLHIGTHGFYIPFESKNGIDKLPGKFLAANKNALFRCGLAFAGVNYYWKNGEAKGAHDDGILNAYEIEQLDFHNVQLVTLSACETALGDVTYDEGNIGLPRAFKLAGAHDLLVSLWKVNAKVSADLLTQFYINWFSGEPLSIALHKAQQSIMKANPEPYFWAGFVLIE